MENRKVQGLLSHCSMPQSKSLSTTGLITFFMSFFAGLFLSPITPFFTLARVIFPKRKIRSFIPLLKILHGLPVSPKALILLKNPFVIWSLCNTLPISWHCLFISARGRKAVLVSLSHHSHPLHSPGWFSLTLVSEYQGGIFLVNHSCLPAPTQGLEEVAPICASAIPSAYLRIPV